MKLTKKQKVLIAISSVLSAFTILPIALASIFGSGTSTVAVTPVAAVKPAVTHSAPASPVPVKTESAAQKAADAKAVAAKRAADAKAAAVKAAAAKAKAAADAAHAKVVAAQQAAKTAAKAAAENAPISAAQWGAVSRDPGSHTGEIYTISGTVSQYDINSNTFASVENAALMATDANGNQFVVEADSSLLGNATPGQTFTAKITVIGAVGTQSVVGGGSGQVPDLDASTFTITG
jgi:hypothetical protein